MRKVKLTGKLQDLLGDNPVSALDSLAFSADRHPLWFIDKGSSTGIAIIHIGRPTLEYAICPVVNGEILRGSGLTKGTLVELIADLTEALELLEDSNG